MRRAMFGGGLALLCSVALGAADAQACCGMFGGGYGVGYRPMTYGVGYGVYSAAYSPWYSSYGYTSYGLFGGGCSSCGMGGCSSCGMGCSSCGYGGCSTCGYGGCSSCGLSGCSTCGSCGMGGCATGGCGLTGCATCSAGGSVGSSSGGCGVDYGTPSVTPRSNSPTPATGAPRTYIDEPATEQTVPQSDPGFRRRDSRSESNESDLFQNRPYNNNSGPEAERGSAFRLPTGSVIQRRQSAPTRPVGGSDDDTLDNAGPQLAPLNLDGKVTWRTAPQRTRVAVEAVYRAPQIARSKTTPNDQWVPVSDTPRLVKK